MDTKMIRRAGAIGVGLLLAGSVGTAAQEPVGGYTWEPFEPGGPDANIFFGGITPLPGDGLAVYGERADEVADGLAIWTSADDGLTWTETVLEGADGSEWEPLYAFHGRYEGEETFSVASHGDGLVAARTVPGKTKRTFILTSADGVEWTIADKLKNVHVDGILSTPDGLAMHGLDFRKAKGFGKRLGGYPTLWLSDDGAEWEAHEITKPLHKPENPPEGGLDEIERSADGTWMALGRGLEFPKRGEPRLVHSIWTAGPDLEWTEVTRPVINGGRSDRWDLYGSTPAGFLFSGGFLDREAQTDGSGLWLTTDGTDWEQIAVTGTPGPEVAVSTGSGAIAWAAPFVWTEPDYRDELTRILAGSPMYVSSDGRTWEHDPATDLLEGIWVGGAHATPDGRVIVEGRDAAGCLGQNMFCVWESESPSVLLIGTPA